MLYKKCVIQNFAKFAKLFSTIRGDTLNEEFPVIRQLRKFMENINNFNILK